MEPRDQGEGAKVCRNRCIAGICKDRTSREYHGRYRGWCNVYTFSQRDTPRFETTKWCVFLSVNTDPQSFTHAKRTFGRSLILVSRHLELPVKPTVLATQGELPVIGLRN